VGSPNGKEYISGAVKMPLTFVFLAMVLVWAFGTFFFPPNLEGQSPVSKTEELSSSPTVSRGVSMRVLWTVSGYKVSADAIWKEEDARKLLFKPLDIGTHEITFDGQTCHDVIFEKEMTSAKSYLDRVYHTTPQALGIENEMVEMVKTNCALPGFAEYMCLKDMTLIIHLNGVFFYFKPAVNY
jgi:hypothetical protein